MPEHKSWEIWSHENWVGQETSIEWTLANATHNRPGVVVNIENDSVWQFKSPIHKFLEWFSLRSFMISFIRNNRRVWVFSSKIWIVFSKFLSKRLNFFFGVHFLQPHSVQIVFKYVYIAEGVLKKCSSLCDASKNVELLPSITQTWTIKISKV